MTDTQNPTIITFVGLAGSGKSSAVEYMSSKGYSNVYFGGIMYEAMQKAGIKPGDWGPEKEFREELRRKEGKGFIAKRAVQKARELMAQGQQKIVLDGLYSWSEYKVLIDEFPDMTVIAVVAPKHLRKKRMATRPERPMNSDEVDQRDWAEIENIEKGGPIAIADYFVQNDGRLEKMHQQIDAILESIDA